MEKAKKDCNRWFGHSRCCNKRAARKCPLNLKQNFQVTRCGGKFMAVGKKLSTFINFGDL